jgi:hypothetical protein
VTRIENQNESEQKGRKGEKSIMSWKAIGRRLGATSK